MESTTLVRTLRSDLTEVKTNEWFSPQSSSIPCSMMYVVFGENIDRQSRNVPNVREFRVNASRFEILEFNNSFSVGKDRFDILDAMNAFRFIEFLEDVQIAGVLTMAFEQQLSKIKEPESSDVALERCGLWGCGHLRLAVFVELRTPSNTRCKSRELLRCRWAYRRRRRRTRDVVKSRLGRNGKSSG